MRMQRRGGHRLIAEALKGESLFGPVYVTFLSACTDQNCKSATHNYHVRFEYNSSRNQELGTLLQTDQE